MIHELVIPRGTNIFVGMMACNRSKALWGDDAYEWKPERWLAPLPEAVEKAAVPGVYSHLYAFLPALWCDHMLARIAVEAIGNLVTA